MQRHISLATALLVALSSAVVTAQTPAKKPAAAAAAPAAQSGDMVSAAQLEMIVKERSARQQGTARLAARGIN